LVVALLLLLGLAREQQEALRGELRGLRRLREDARGLRRQLEAAELTGAIREETAERMEIGLEVRAPVAGRARIDVVTRAERAAPAARSEELVDAREQLVGPDFGGVDLVGHPCELVRLVDDRAGEGRVVGRPAQQEVVVRDDEVRVGERLAPAAEG